MTSTKKKKTEVYILTTPHDEGMRVSGVYSTEAKAEKAAGEDQRNRVETREVDGDPD